LARVDFQGTEYLLIAPDGLHVGQKVVVGGNEVSRGNVVALGDLPEGTLVYNLELHPGDGGKLCRAAGATAVVVSQGDSTLVQLPSGSFRAIDPRCRASVGVVAGAGQGDKPIMKAGKKWHVYRSRAKRPFKVSGVAMNVVSHPHGGGSHQHVGRPSTVPYNAPPGRKVGRLSPKPKRVRDKIKRR
jgi:large subunit ribosomal protein L2